MLFHLAQVALLWQVYYFYQAFKNIVDNSQTPIQLCTDSCLLCTQYVPGLTVGSGDLRVNKADTASTLLLPIVEGPDLFNGP